MAPPNNRRPGHSRRAQYGTFFGYVIAAVGVLVGGGLLLASTSNPAAFGSLRGAASDVTAPVAQVSARARTGTNTVFETLAGFFTFGNRVARLEREVALARVKLAEAQALQGENQRLKALLALGETQPRPVTFARLIGSTASSSRRFALLGAGSAQGVQIGMPVRSPLGLVGRVLEVGRVASRVLLITDSESMVPVRRASDGLEAYATGRSDGTLQLRLINSTGNALKPGDAFVTSGQGGLFRPGIAVAVVATPIRDGAIARPLSAPGASDFVSVEPLWDEAAKGPDLPPEPATQSAGKP
jgi:rod shape-determining protein MreC